MKIYYSHPMQMYRNDIEKIHIEIIKNKFPNCQIMNPSNYTSHDMNYYLKKVEKSDILVYIKFKNKITAGVGKELNHAIECKIPVYEIKNKKLQHRIKKVIYLTPSESSHLN